MQRDQLDRLFEETRQLPEEVSYAHIEKLVLLQPVVPIAAAKIAVWWKTKIFLNTLTVSVLTTAATGVVYLSTGKKAAHTQHTVTAPASFHQPEKEALPLTPVTPPSEPQQVTEEIPAAADSTVTQHLASIADSIHAVEAGTYRDNTPICTGQNSLTVGASVSTASASVVFSEGNGYSYLSVNDGSGNDISEADGSSSENGNAAPDDYRSYNEDPPPACNCSHATDSIWDCIERSLTSEALIDRSQRWYKFYLTPSVFEINDNKQPEDIAIRYRALYERLSGETLSKHYKIEVLIDNSKNQKRLTIDQRD